MATWIWAALILLAGWAAFYRTDDTDYWFHLGAGRSIAEHGIPKEERWCLAARGEAPWLSEWLFHRALYAVHTVAGDSGVAIWRILWAMAAMALALEIARMQGGAAWSAVLLAPLMLAVARERMQPRPDQVFVAFVLVAAVLFERARARRRDSTRWLVPIQALWANLHVSWAFGPAIAWVYGAAAWLWERPRPSPGGKHARAASEPAAVSDRRGPAAPLRRQPRAWMLLGAALWLASALVPLPLETLSTPFRFPGDVAVDPLTGSIEELRPWSWSADAREPFTAWLALCLLAALIGGRHAWRASPALTLLALAALALGLLGVRFRALAVWLSFPGAALALIPRGAVPRRRVALGAATAAGIAGVLWLATARQFPPGVAPRWHTVPVRAAALAESLRLSGPVLNTFHYGGYILWARGEDQPPLVDGRGRGSLEFRSRFARAHSDPGALDSLLSAWRFTHAVLEPPRRPEDRMAIALGRRPEWELVFADDAGLLYSNRERYPKIATARAYRLFGPDYAAMGAIAERSLVDSTLRRAFEAELERARAESPWHGRASLWLGLLALAGRDGPRAVRLLEEVERLAPATPGLALRLGMARQLSGDAHGARAAYARAQREPADREAAREALRGLR